MELRKKFKANGRNQLYAYELTTAETFEARKSLKTVIAGLAARRATSEQLAEMSEENCGDVCGA